MPSLPEHKTGETAESVIGKSRLTGARCNSGISNNDDISKVLAAEF